mmetsp:Transcript_28075/g.37485  ORF Transcript_28075/g.37485 Transcript_28075/m.37485 type:complete len:92 (+) Transcript_28075:1242-1517(+)
MRKTGSTPQQSNPLELIFTPSKDGGVTENNNYANNRSSHLTKDEADASILLCSPVESNSLVFGGGMALKSQISTIPEEEIDTGDGGTVAID